MSEKNVLWSDKRLQLTAEAVLYRKGLKWHSIALADLVRTYRRVEEATARLCCGVAEFTTHYIMLVPAQGETVKVEMTQESMAKEFLDAVKQQAPHIAIGLPATKKAPEPCEE